MIEFPTSNAASSAEFFQSAFGWSHLSYGPQYTDVQLGQDQTLGFQADRDDAPTAPLVVIEVDDLDAAQAAVQAAGGTITVESFDFPGGRLRATSARTDQYVPEFRHILVGTC